MDVSELRSRQAPLKEKYQADPDAAATPVSATADFSSDGITAIVQTWAGPVRAGLHTATGGDGQDACSGDMLVQAVLACAGVTARSVATAMRIDIREARLRADAMFDARGTLGLSRDVPVGLQQLTVTIDLDTTADDAALARLAQLTERYCVVGQSLAPPPTFVVRRIAVS